MPHQALPADRLRQSCRQAGKCEDEDAAISCNIMKGDARTALTIEEGHVIRLQSPGYHQGCDAERAQLRASIIGWERTKPSSPGIAPAHRWLIDDLLTAGRLEAVLPNHEPPPVPLRLLIVPERAGIARVRLLVDFLAGQIAGIPGIETPRPGR